MKNFYLLFSLAFAGVVSAQTTIYSENFGAGAGSTNPTVSVYTGYQNSTPISYSCTADIRISTPSDTYAGASGQGCVFLGGTTPEKSISISGINTLGFKDLVLSFGHQKGTNASNNELIVEVSADNTNWTPLTYTRATGSGTSIWTLITATGSIPETANLGLRFRNNVSNIGFRIDDVKIVGDKVLATQDIKTNHFTIYPTIVSNNIINISSKNNAVKNVKIYDLSSKLMINTQTQKEVNVSTLKKGIYIINVEENGQKESSKFIIK